MFDVTDTEFLPRFEAATVGRAELNLLPAVGFDRRQTRPSPLTFIADHDAELIDANLTREEQIRFLTNGTGFLGSSFDYLRNIDRKFAALGIEDEEVTALLQEAESLNPSC